MTLFEQWNELTNQERGEAERTLFWKEYFDLEKSVYEKILSRPDEPYTGKFTELAEAMGFDNTRFAGFLYGINTSLKRGEYDMDAITEDSDVCFEADLEKLYYNMHAAKAEWLYNLPAWETLLGEDVRRAIAKEQRMSGTFTREGEIGRNDPCPCGSGKKYKKCCGAA